MVAEILKIDVKTLADWLSKKRPVTILDVRPKHEREEWSIPGSVHADVYHKLKANERDVFSDLKFPDAPVVTVCGAGKTSLMAAEQLKEKGLEVYSLEGGMKAWNFAWNTALVLPAHTPNAVPFDNKVITAPIGEIKEKLDMLKLNEKEFVQYTLSRIPPAPPNYLTLAGLNKKGLYEGYTPSELEAGANRCAIG